MNLRTEGVGGIMIIRIFDLELVTDSSEGLDRNTELLIVILGFIGICLYLNWFYTLLALGILSIIIGSLMFDKSFDEIEKQIKEQSNGNS